MQKKKNLENDCENFKLKQLDVICFAVLHSGPYETKK